MATTNIVYQATAGRLKINSRDFSIEDISMDYYIKGGVYYVTLFSKTYQTNFTDVPLSTIRDNVGGDYANIAAWIAWWDALEFGMEVEAVVTGGATSVKQDTIISDLSDLEDDVEAGNIILTDGSQETKTVDEAGNFIYPAGEPVTQAVEITRPADTTAYTANDAINSSTTTPVAFEFTGMAVAAGGGGMLAQVKIETDITAAASQQLRLWFYNAAPTNIANDNAAHVNYYADKATRLFYIDVNMDALLAGSDEIIGVTLPLYEAYNCAATSLFVLVQALTGFTPTSGGKLYITLSANKMS